MILLDANFRTMSDALSRLPPEVQQMAQQQISAETNAEKKRQVALGFIQGRVRVRVYLYLIFKIKWDQMA